MRNQVEIAPVVAFGGMFIDRTASAPSNDITLYCFSAPQLYRSVCFLVTIETNGRKVKDKKIAKMVIASKGSGRALLDNYTNSPIQEIALDRRE